MPDSKPRIMIIGAHPDDADIKAGGSAALCRQAGHEVCLVSLTNGQAGHQTQAGPGLAARRKAEAQAAGDVIGARYEVLDIPDGELDARLEFRHRVIRLIRAFKPDLVITHRSTDYHADHRFTGLLVQDAAYLLTVPAICPETPFLQASPVILYFSDTFKKPCRFEPHIVVDIEPAFEKMMDMLDCHVSQFYEWLPFNAGIADQVPADAGLRRAWLAERMKQRIGPLANRCRDKLVQTYGPERGSKIRFIEAFEVSEFGAPMTPEVFRGLFPFLPNSASAAGFSRKEWVDMPEDD